LILIRFSGSFSSVPLLSAGDHPKVGDAVRVVGCPLGICNIATEGRITNGHITVVGNDEFEGMIISASGFPSTSGAGIFWQGPRGWVEISVLQDIGSYLLPVPDLPTGPAPYLYRPPNTASVISIGVSPDKLLAFLRE